MNTSSLACEVLRVLQCVAVCCGVLQCVAVCCSALISSRNAAWHTYEYDMLHTSTIFIAIVDWLQVTSQGVVTHV